MQNALVCSYSRTISGWLINKFPGDVSLDSSGAGNEEIISVFQLLLPAVEFEATTQGHLNLSGRIKKISGLVTKKEQLVWLVNLFALSDLPEPVKDELFEQLQVFVKWNIDAALTWMSGLRLPAAKSFRQGKIIKPAKTSLLVRKKITAPVFLAGEEKTFLLDVMKISLALRCRETDPVTFADKEAVELFEIGGGFFIAIVGMQKEKRLSLESYVGYMVFKNELPIAYGGGWIWGQRCRIGISIYPDFRKGESAWIFSQVLRLYYQYFNARHFIIRANQFGKDNRDGLKSGAFWFYFKLGFRPVDNEIKKLAIEEWKKIQADKNYRSSLKTLKLFTACPMEWEACKTFFRVVDAETVSRKISEMIDNEYGSSRVIALRSARIRLRKKFKYVSETGKFENWYLLINLLIDFQHWNRNDKKQLLDLIGIKQDGTERDHIIGMQNFRLFWKSLATAINEPA